MATMLGIVPSGGLIVMHPMVSIKNHQKNTSKAVETLLDVVVELTLLHLFRHLEKNPGFSQPWLCIRSRT